MMVCASSCRCGPATRRTASPTTSSRARRRTCCSWCTRSRRVLEGASRTARATTTFRGGGGRSRGPSRPSAPSAATRRWCSSCATRAAGAGCRPSACRSPARRRRPRRPSPGGARPSRRTRCGTCTRGSRRRTRRSCGGAGAASSRTRCAATTASSRRSRRPARGRRGRPSGPAPRRSSSWPRAWPTARRAARGSGTSRTCSGPRTTAARRWRARSRPGCGRNSTPSRRSSPRR
mmetsp:Transcript_11543/g.30118  ORF Transcript_11543/g.30118 Transcript_11543/m.30118 type:complete len:234 (+) Transcript_11543:355-1056(+)